MATIIRSRFILRPGHITRRSLYKTLSFRHLSTKETALSDQHQKEQTEDVPEEEFAVSVFSQNQLVPEHPIKSLDLIKRIDKVEKKGSFSVDIFKGSYDHDFLTYPEILDNRVENQELKAQVTMVKQLWPQIWDDNRQLQKFNFFNLYQISVTEMMTIFEAIGASSRKCTELNIPGLQGKTDTTQHQTLVTKTIISLINRNCLTYWPMSRSENEKIHRFLPKTKITFGGIDDIEQGRTPIGFCWTEQAPNLGSLPPQEWQTLGQSGDEEVGHYLITGRKTRVLYEENTENYLVYFRDKSLLRSYEEKNSDDEPNIASDPFVGACLLNKADLKFSDVYLDSAEIPYVDIDIDTVVPTENLVLQPKRKDPSSVNIKSLGQLATCSVVLGMLKDAQRRTYKYLLENKKGLLNCDIIERKLTIVTSRIFAIESMVYYVSGMYDGLKDGFDAHMEATILKIVTNDYAYEVLRELQQISGSEMYFTSKIQDQINILDAYLDGVVYNRLYLATMGVIWFARSKNMHLNQLRLAPWYPGYFVKSLLRDRSEQRDYLTLNCDIYGQLHPALKEAATNLEYILKRVKYATESLCMKHGKDVTGAQSSLYRLAQLSIDSFVLTTLCARASKSYCNGSRNSEIDIAITTSFSWELARRVKMYIEEIQLTPLTMLDSRAGIINELNLKHGGYYAESPLDPNI